MWDHSHLFYIKMACSKLKHTPNISFPHLSKQYQKIYLTSVFLLQICSVYNFNGSCRRIPFIMELSWVRGFLAGGWWWTPWSIVIPVFPRNCSQHAIGFPYSQETRRWRQCGDRMIYNHIHNFLSPLPHCSLEVNQWVGRTLDKSFTEEHKSQETKIYWNFYHKMLNILRKSR